MAAFSRAFYACQELYEGGNTAGTAYSLLHHLQWDQIVERLLYPDPKCYIRSMFDSKSTWYYKYYSTVPQNYSVRGYIQVLNCCLGCSVDFGVDGILYKTGVESH